MRYTLFCCMCLLLALVSCNKHNDESHVSCSDYITHANGFSVIENDGYIVVQIRNPWKTGSLLQSYILVPHDKAMPDSLPKGTVIRTPLNNSLVYSSVHANVIKELGHLSAVKGVCDVQYFTMPEITGGVKNGVIANVGSSMAPVTERIIAMSPDAIILSPYQSTGYIDVLPKGIPVVECADYMETSPLGRAEWIKLFGLLLNERERADSIFSAVEKDYNELKSMAQNIAGRPKVLSETIINGTWYVPGGDSYMAQLFTDAGGDFPWSDVKTSGSIPLDMAQVLNKAHDADIWLVKSFDPTLSYNKLKSQHALNEKFKAFKEKKIYFCDTERTTFFQDFPFHPELLLREYISIFHSQQFSDYNLKYFKPLKDE